MSKHCLGRKDRLQFAATHNAGLGNMVCALLANLKIYYNPTVLYIVDVFLKPKLIMSTPSSMPYSLPLPWDKTIFFIFLSWVHQSLSSCLS